jgi:hypothetical protein
MAGEVEKMKRQVKELEQHLAYVHGQAAAHHRNKQRQLSRANNAPEENNANQAAQQGAQGGQNANQAAQQGPVGEQERHHINHLSNQIRNMGHELHAENSFLPADSQLGICSLSNGDTTTTTQNVCRNTFGFRSWTPL